MRNLSDTINQENETYVVCKIYRTKKRTASRELVGVCLGWGFFLFFMFW